MISLAQATPAEFEVYRGFAAADTGADGTTRQDIDGLLPDGIDTKGHHLLAVRLEPRIQVGFLWLTVIDRTRFREAFVLDLVIFPEFRRHGFARAALSQLDEYVARLGLDTISLTVFERNVSARTLYERNGFAPMFTRMTKKLRKL